MNFAMNLYTGTYTCNDYLPTFTLTATKVGSPTPEASVFLNYVHLGDGLGYITSTANITALSTANYSISVLALMPDNL
jgi:hypothetical protein